MKVKFTQKDPRRGQTAELPEDQAKAMIASGAAVQVKGDAAAADDSATLTTTSIAKKTAKPAKTAAIKAPAKKAAAKRASKAGGK